MARILIWRRISLTSRKHLQYVYAHVHVRTMYLKYAPYDWLKYWGMAILVCRKKIASGNKDILPSSHNLKTSHIVRSVLVDETCVVTSWWGHQISNYTKSNFNIKINHISWTTRGKFTIFAPLYRLLIVKKYLQKVTPIWPLLPVQTGS